MKTSDFAKALGAFADFSDDARARELTKLAIVFNGGQDETLATRVKKWSPSTGHPALLKDTLKKIQSCLKTAGASKQAASIDAVLDALSGSSPNIGIDEFIAQITAPPPPPAPKKKQPRPPAEPDFTLARQLADELTRTVLSTPEFGEVVKRLRAAKVVNTPTLAIVANKFLGNDKHYDGRKEPIDDIVKRQKADAREHARGQALKRVGV